MLDHKNKVELRWQKSLRLNSGLAINIQGKDGSILA